MTALGTTSTGEDLAVDLDRLIGSHACIVANSGGGKSGLVRRLLETTHGRVQHIVLDGEDEFYTLRERYSYVIAGGDGDAPATVANAESLALGALEHGFSLIAQLNDLGADGAPAFIGGFLTALVNAPRHLWHPVLVVIDEAQRFAPRVGSTGATDGIKALLAQGRKRGFTAVLAGTKLTEIDPAARGMCNNWMLGRVGQSLDRRTMAEELGFTAKEARERLQSIEPRQFWGFGPAIARDPVLFRVADVETTPIHAGQAKVPTPPAPAALRKILAGLAAAVGPAPATSATSDTGEKIIAPSWPDLRHEVAQLKADLEEAAARGEKAGYQRGLSAGISIGITRCRATIAALRVPAIIEDLDNEIPAAPATEETRPTAPGRDKPAPSPATVPPKPIAEARRRQPAEQPDGALAKPLQKIIDAAAWWRAFGIDRPRAHQVAYIAGYAATSGTWDTYRSRLRAQGLVEVGGGRMWLTEAGSAHANAPIATPTVEALHAAVRDKLATPLQKFFDVVTGAYPDTISRADWAERAGYQPASGTADTYRSRMMALDLAESPERGFVRAADWLFP